MSALGGLYFNKISRTRTIIDFLHMLNLINIAVAVPFTIAFQEQLDPTSFLVWETCSVLLHCLIMAVHLRTPVPLVGSTSLRLGPVLSQYYEQGLLPDLLGALPLNLVLGYL